MFYIHLIRITAMLFSPFMSGVTMDTHGQMVVDMDKTRTVIQQVIPPTTSENTSRGDQVLFQIDRIVKAINEYNESYGKSGREVVRLYTEYESKPEDFQKILAQMDTEKEAGQMKILDACFEMRKVMTPDEWKAVFSPETRNQMRTPHYKN
jgi:hypothetical protein